MRIGILCLCIALFCAPLQGADASEPVDLVIYGATSGGVAAAVQAARMGKSVLLVEPGKHVGGLTSGGLGATDIGNKGAIGGISREFYRRIGEHYDRPDAWKFQTADAFRSQRKQTGEKEMWTFEPHVAERFFQELLAEHKVRVLFHERLDLQAGVKKEGARIRAIVMESGLTLHGKMFIDATYEGDLLAKAGIAYTIGREANATYGETLNGVQVQNAVHHQFIVKVDPYIKPGDPASGFLPGITGTEPGTEGSADRRVQAYCFRMCQTDSPENRVPWEKPANYDPLRYELLLRNFEAGDMRVPWSPTAMPNRKTDTNNNFAVSTDNIGRNYDYADGDYATRDRIFREHLAYQQGLMWTLANHPRVPEAARKIFTAWGLSRDEFAETGHWPHQLYVREARRMIGSYVMTQHNCQGRERVADPVGLAAYTMDSHNVQRYVRDGQAWNEGDVQIGGFPPYPISYRAIIPKAADCENLLVPVCLSATHISYGSIRMEPVFMVLGQSAATAAVQAIDSQTSVQQVDYAKLRERLLADQQVLDWTASGGGRDVKKLPGLVVDDAQAEVTGNWTTSTSIAGFVGSRYLHDADADKGKKQVRFKLSIDRPGRYDVRVAYTANPNRATNVPVIVVSAEGEKSVLLNQRKAPTADGFQSVGTFRFEKSGEVTIGNEGTDGYVIVDAVQLIPQ